MKNIKYFILIVFFFATFSSELFANPWIIQMTSVTDTGQRRSVPIVVTNEISSNNILPDNLSELREGLVKVEWIFANGSRDTYPPSKLFKSKSQNAQTSGEEVGIFGPYRQDNCAYDDLAHKYLCTFHYHAWTWIPVLTRYYFQAEYAVNEVSIKLPW